MNELSESMAKHINFSGGANVFVDKAIQQNGSG